VSLGEVRNDGNSHLGQYVRILHSYRMRTCVGLNIDKFIRSKDEIHPMRERMGTSCGVTIEL
jgi:hypothetical protein